MVAFVSAKQVLVEQAKALATEATSVGLTDLASTLTALSLEIQNQSPSEKEFFGGGTVSYGFGVTGGGNGSGEDWDSAALVWAQTLASAAYVIKTKIANTVKNYMANIEADVDTIAAKQTIIADKQTIIADKQTIIADKQTSIAADTIRIRVVQERMRSLADTIGITTRSQYDYLHVHSTLKGLELDGQGIGDALRAFASVPSITAVNPPPEVLPPVKQSVLDWKGPWEENKSYVINDVAIQNGKSYIALKNNKGSPPGDNQIWKLMDDKAIIESEKPKEIWKGTWEKSKTYTAGSIVSYKPGLELTHIKGLEDLEHDPAPAKLYKALETVQSYDFSGIIPTDEPDVNGEKVWESIEHDIAPDKALTLKLNNVQVIGSIGEFNCEGNTSAKLEIEGPVIVEKIPYTIDDFVQQFKGLHSAATYKAKALNIMPLYISNDAYSLSSTHTEQGPDSTTITVQDIRYGLARYPDPEGLAYWTNTSLANGYDISSQNLIDAFFASVNSIAGYTRHLRFNKKFDSRNTGGGFCIEPEDWVATNSTQFYWNSRSISSAAPISHPAWGNKMNTYAVWEAPNIYNPIIRPISGTDGIYNINVGKPIRISILGGPPNSTVIIAKRANVDNFFFPGYVANNTLTGTLTLDNTGTFVDDPQVLQNAGVITYTATFQNQYTILNGYSRDYVVTVGTNFVEPSVPTKVEDYLRVDYETVKKLNVGYEFTREATINIPADGFYVFQAWTDNWGKIELDSNKILDFNNNFHNTTGPATYGTTLKKGNHVVKLSCINYGAQSAGNPGGIALTISSGGAGRIKNHKGSKRYKIKTTNEINIFKLVNLDGSEVITDLGSAEGYRFYVEKKMPNPDITEIAFKGCWESATLYKVHEKVLHNEVTWIALRDNSNNEPAANSRYWKEITTEDAAFIDDPPLWKGAWNDETTYVKNSIVSYKDKSWIAQKLVQSVPKPPPPDLSGTDWKVVDDPAIHCEAPEAIFTPPVPEPEPLDATLKYQGTYDETADYYPFDVVDTETGALIFVSPPYITDFNPIQDIVLDEGEPEVDEYDPLMSYNPNDVVLFDGDYYMAIDPIGPDGTGPDGTGVNSPSNRPNSWARLAPKGITDDSQYKVNDIVKADDKPYLVLLPGDGTGTGPGSGTVPGDGTGTGPGTGQYTEILAPKDGKGGIGIKGAPTDYDVWKSVDDYITSQEAHFIGPWDWRTYYTTNDVVIFCEVLYIAKENSIGAVPPYNIVNIPDTPYPETKWIKLELSLEIF